MPARDRVIAMLQFELEDPSTDPARKDVLVAVLEFAERAREHLALAATNIDDLMKDMNILPFKGKGS